MSKTNLAMAGLTGLRVVKNCPANWHRMDGDDQVRLCTQCSQNVYNLSGMDSQSAAKLINESEGKLCVRYFVRPDGMVMTTDCPKAQARKVRIIVAVASVLSVFGIVLAFPFFAQGAMATPETMVRHDLRRIKDIGDELKETTDPAQRTELISLRNNYKKFLRDAVDQIRSRDK